MDTETNYKVVQVRDYYPSKETPTSSTWIYDIVFNLKELGLNSLVISPVPYIPKFIKIKSYGYRSNYVNKDIEKYEGTDVIRPLFFKIPFDKFSFFTLWSLKKTIYSSIKNISQPKLIHAHFGKNGIASLKLQNEMNIPLVTSFYGFDVSKPSGFIKKQYENLGKAGSLFLALSIDMKNDLIKLGFPEDKVIVHYLGIDTKKFKPVERKDKKNFTFLIVARFNEKKGIQDVLSAFSMIANKNMELVIIGDGPYKNKLENIVSKYNLFDKVKFINNFEYNNPRAIVLEQIQNCDVFLLTSFLTKDNHKEGTPVVLMEAQACGKPCISTYHAGIPEVVLHEKTGFLVKERDIKMIAEYMLKFFNDKSLIKRTGANAREHICENFDITKQTRKLINIYNSIIQE